MPRDGASLRDTRASPCFGSLVRNSLVRNQEKLDGRIEQLDKEANSYPPANSVLAGPAALFAALAHSSATTPGDYRSMPLTWPASPARDDVGDS